jgi:1-acyl-sn-glycerol-3-phosphate acyltransferase
MLVKILKRRGTLKEQPFQRKSEAKEAAVGQEHWEAPDWWYEFWRPWVRTFWSLGYWVHYTGVEKVPLSGPTLLVSNHQSHFDPPLLGGPIRRRCWYFARKSLFKLPPVALLFSSLGGIPVDVKGSPVAGVKESLRQLRKGRALVMFPEGTRTWDGSLGPFRPGFTLLARRAEATIVPAAIQGAYEAWPRWRPFPRWGIIHVMYLDPIRPEDYRGWSDEELVAEVRRRIEVGCELLQRRPILREWKRWIRQLGWDRPPKEGPAGPGPEHPGELGKMAT